MRIQTFLNRVIFVIGILSFVAVNLYVTVDGEVGTRSSMEARNVTVKPPVLPEGVSMEEYL